MKEYKFVFLFLLILFAGCKKVADRKIAPGSSPVINKQNFSAPLWQNKWFHKDLNSALDKVTGPNC